MAERTHYRVIIKCFNCSNRLRHDVKLGVTAVEHIKKNNITCAICECKDARLAPDGTVE